jgi:hypothetical protein
MLRTVKRSTGTSQLGFLTMSSNVFLGENRTLNARLNALICGCDSGTAGGTALVVAIWIILHHEVAEACCRNSSTQRPVERFQAGAF